MNSIWRFFVVFLALTGAVALGTSILGLEFGRGNYWNVHGFFFLASVAIFPRLTLILSGVATGGILWWLSWIFAPRILVAVLATLNYWYQNPVLVVIAWLVALGGESSEKFVVVQRSSGFRQGYESARWVKSETQK